MPTSPSCGDRCEDRLGELDEVGDDLVQRHVRAWPIDSDELVDRASEADPGGGERVDVDLERDDRGAVGVRMHER